MRTNEITEFQPFNPVKRAPAYKLASIIEIKIKFSKQRRIEVFLLVNINARRLYLLDP